MITIMYNDLMCT